MGFSGPVETNGCQSNNTREHKILFKFYLAGSRLFGYLQIKPRSWTLMFTRSSTSQWSKMVLEPASSWFKFVALTTSPPYLILIIGCFCQSINWSWCLAQLNPTLPVDVIYLATFFPLFVPQTRTHITLYFYQPMKR